MRKIIAGFACSLDGYIEGPKGEIDWIIIDKEIDFNKEMKKFDAFLYGRKTYESVLIMGANATSKADHYVFSKTLTTVAPGYTLMQGDVAAQVLDIKQQQGKDIALFGGANLLSTLLNLNMVDEISVSIIPVLLGEGKPMADVLKTRVILSLLSSKTYGNGTIQLTYTCGHTGD
jgi:dihydrofolate reductase